MLDRRLVAGLAFAALLICPHGAGAAMATPALPSFVPDSAQALGPQSVPAVRAAYQNAWAQRQAGDFTAAAEVAEAGLVMAGAALAARPDMSTRVTLTELQSKLAGLRDASRKDLQSQASAKASGNDADEKVLNAPATDNVELQINADVLRWVEHFTGSGRSTFERWLKRSGRYVDLFRAALQKEGLPSELAQLVFVESGFNVNARSTSAAVGPWQFLRSTGKLFGLTVNQWVDERKDPEKSTVAAARYLKHLYSIFGDWPLALASYNAGEGTVLRAIKRQGTTNYWDLRLPREAEEYVPQYMAVLAISRDPKLYGFDSVELDEPMAFDEVAFKGTIDLRALAKLADCEVSELKQLNPAILNHAVRGPDGVTSLRVPRGKGEVLMKRLQDGATLPAVDLTVKHRVRRGETLQRIADQYHVSARQLALANGIGKKRPLRRGMMLTVPASLSAPPLAILESEDPRTSTSYVPARQIRPIRSLGANSTAQGRVTVTVRKGETLATIASRYGVSVEDIKRWNHLNTSVVRRGTRLKIRTDRTAAIEPSAADSAKIADLRAPSGRKVSAGTRRASGRSVVVKRGETLAEIAARHKVSVLSLKKANRLRGSTIRAGQRLKLPTS
jgi:membrane-bound lytic murein transglycosylase D